MSKGTEGHFDTLPIGRLGLIPLNSSAALGIRFAAYTTFCTRVESHLV